MGQEPIPAMKNPKTEKTSSRKLLYLIILFFFILCMILFFNSTVSKITVIEISGYDLLTEAEILEVSNVQYNDQFLGTSTKKVSSRIQSHEMIEQVHVHKKFPGHLFIEVTEYSKSAYEWSAEGELIAILSNGVNVSMKDKQYSMTRPLLTGWQSMDDLKGKLSEELAKVPDDILMDISEIRPDPTEAFPDRIRLFTRSHFEVISTVELIAEKIYLLDDIIYEMKQENMTTGLITLMLANHGTSLEPDPDKISEYSQSDEEEISEEVETDAEQESEADSETEELDETTQDEETSSE